MTTSDNLSINNKEYLFIEKYRPKNIQDLVLPEALKTKVKEWIKDEQIPNLLLNSRGPGLGKTSLCHVLIEETGADALFLNASLYPNIDILRSKIQGFVSTCSFNGNPKIVVLDESDFLNQNSTQPALRGFIESFSKNARFILTCNHVDKIIPPLRDRLIEINFDDMYNKSKVELITNIFHRTVAILENEEISYTGADIKYIIKHFYPSSRKILNKIQEFTVNKKLVVNKDDVDSDSLNLQIIDNIKNPNFDKIRANCAKLSDPSLMFSALYEHIDEFPEEFRPEIIICIAKYQVFDSQVRDRVIIIVACCTEIMKINSRNK